MKVIIEMLVLAALLWTPSCEKLVYVKEGDTVTLRLDGLEANSKYLYWSHHRLQSGWLAWRHPLRGWSFTQDERWAGRLSVSQDALSINGVKGDDFGTVVFSRLSNLHGEITPMKSFTISKITVSVDTKYTVLVSHEVVTLSCHVDTPPNHRQPELYWLNPVGERITPSGGQFRVAVTGRDNGRWSCVVVKDDGEDTAWLFITVLDLLPAPEFPLYTSEQSSLSIPCPFAFNISWEQFQPRKVKKVSWCSGELFYQQFIINPEMILVFSPNKAEQGWRSNTSRGKSFVADLQKGGLILSKKQWGVEDRGHYRCKIKFGNDNTLSRTVSVEVLRVVSSTGLALHSGQSVNLTCSLGKALPRDHWVKWFPPERSAARSLLSSGRPDPPQIVLAETGPDDGGRWRCELWRNTTRLTSAEITLAVSRRLSAWMPVSIGGAAAVIAVLLLLICITWRHRRRVRETKFL
ncbi:CD4-1 molecule [Hippocampus zosterae]|uniref:CD4-1 molecule n=1 Tax=Hippocampus zosterae TaxID=109293 RepID=UPI00223E1D9D|nr:CD4-1 molecule [Hippocampus zosterae]